jgi:subtilisin family serine protease
MMRQVVVCVGIFVFMFFAGAADAGGKDGLGPIDLPGDGAKSRPGKSSPIYPTLDTGLNQILTTVDPVEKAESLGFRIRDGRVQVVAVTVEGSEGELTSWLGSREAKHISTFGNLVQAFVPFELLWELERHRLVRFVRKPDYIVRPPQPAPFEKTKMVTYTTQGVAAMNANAWHSNGYTGQGITVGVIDLGFEGYGSLLGTDLPIASKVITNGIGGTNLEADGPHGTACAEIIHDLAPGISQMYLVAVSTAVDIGNALIWLDEQDVDIISMSVGSGITSGAADGTGPMVQLIDMLVANDRVVAISAGNSAQEHWQGTFQSADGDGWMEFAGGDAEINAITNLARTDRLWIPAGEEITARLVWNQWDSPTTDLDFCLFKTDGEGDPVQIECSDDLQNGGDGQFPRETIEHTVVEAGEYGVAVKWYSGDPNVDVELEIVDWPVQYVVESGSISVPADAASAITVAALDAASPYPLESYSSRGPTNGPGGSLSGGFIKPDIAGYANVSTASYGPRSGAYSFNGTSAACPHVAGAAALVWSAYPSYSRSQVRSLLESRAQDKGVAGKDNSFGHGRLYLGAAPASACSYSLSPTSKSFGSSGGSGSISVSTSSGCSWSASASKSWIRITGGSSGSGNGSVSYSVDANSATSQRSGTISAAGKTFTITQSGSSGGGSGSTGDNTYLAVIAHTTGANNSVWKSSLSLCNVSTSNASVKLTYRYGSSGVVVRNTTIAAYGLAEWTDAPVDLFNVGGKSSGVVTIESNQRLQVAARTFNTSPDGTFGQSLPGVSSAVSMTSSQFGILSPVRRNWQFRTNVGFINTGTKSCTVTIFFGNTNGYVIGEQLSITLAPGQWKQVNEVLKKAGVSSANAAIGFVQIETAGATVWAYATVVDNSSGDPTALGLAIYD